MGRWSSACIRLAGECPFSGYLKIDGLIFEYKWKYSIRKSENAPLEGCIFVNVCVCERVSLRERV